MTMSEKTESRFGNFMIEGIREVDNVTESETIPSVRFRLRLDTGEVTDEILLPLDGTKGLRKVDFYSLHPHIKLDGKETTVQRDVMNMIRTEMAKKQKEIRYSINRLGTHMVDGKPIFNEGDRLVQGSFNAEPESSTSVVLQSRDYRIDIDPDIDECSAVSGIAEVIGLSPDALRVILAHSLAYIMRSAYNDAWKAPCCSLFLYGGTGQFKTTVSAFLTQIHNRRDGIAEPARLNASIPAALDIIYKKSDCVVVLDDLCPRDSKRTMEQQEKTLLEITRVIADGTNPARMKGGAVSLKPPPSCGVLFTGEYLIGTGSDAARIIPIQFATPIDPARLKSCQDCPLIVSTFYHYFIVWFIENYDVIRDLLKTWWEEYAHNDLGVHKRLHESHFFLNSAYKLFLRYCVEKEFTSSEDEQSHHRSFLDLLTHLVREQDKRVQQGVKRDSTQVDYLELIRTLYKGDSFHLAKNRKQYESVPDKYDGLIYDELICLRSEQMLNKICQSIPAATCKDVRHALLDKGALWVDAEGKNKKVGQKRFIGIYLKRLR